jgi:RNA polymerase-binding protein DksA
MEQAKIDHFKNILMALREKISGDVTNLEQNSLAQTLKDQTGQLSGYSIHLADVASDSYDRDFNINLASLEQNILKDIDNALEKLSSGQYGACETCSAPISESRLEAVPYARLCLDCKREQEQSGSKK